MQKRDAIQAALGDRIGYLRKQRGLKQSQLAERLGVALLTCVKLKGVRLTLAS